MTNETTQPDLEILRALAEAVKDWSNCNQAWQHRDPDYEGIAVVGAVDEDGIDWPLAEIDADTYGHDGESLKVAQYYAAANPRAVLTLLASIDALHSENERLQAAERTMQSLGYQDRGGQQWVPPIGKAPDFDLIDSLRSRIAELEARKPLPPDALADKCEAWLQAGSASNIVDAFEAGYRAAEGITGGSS